ncbi:elongation factor [Salix suchowensis]|nr:elongation factor [Salix suchowensis]
MDIKPDCKLQISNNAVIDRENRNVQETSDGLYTLLECILQCTKINETRSAEDEDPDATEYSSSFADTTSDTERCSGLSEAELDSQFFGDSDLASPYDAFDVIFQTRACSSFEGFCSKSMSLSFSNEFCRRKAIKRRKSKRVEDITDAALHVTNHNPFHLSRSNPEGTSEIDDFSNTGKFGDDDIFLEQVLWKIEIVHSRNASKFSSSENLSFLHTVGLLSSADVTFHQQQIGDSSEDVRFHYNQYIHSLYNFTTTFYFTFINISRIFTQNLNFSKVPNLMKQQVPL